MTDRVSPETRSRVMSSVKSKGSKIEQAFESLLIDEERQNCVKHSPNITGKPDFAFPDAKVAVFVDSCFWHGCDEHLRLPASNQDYWIKKIERNKRRDREVEETLSSEGWRVLRIWEHDLKDENTMAEKLEQMRELLHQQ